jgi:hypothetical protein
MQIQTSRELSGDEKLDVEVKLMNLQPVGFANSLHIVEEKYVVDGKSYSLLIPLNGDEVIIRENSFIDIASNWTKKDDSTMAILSNSVKDLLDGYAQTERYFEAPINENVDFSKLPNSVFLAGGISNCNDWQAKAALQILNDTDWVVFNPRRYDFDINDPLQSEIQIKWEHLFLKNATQLIFWFPNTSVCPITLFEYGKWLGKKQIHLGCEPGYIRQFDLELQTSLEIGVNLNVSTSIDDLVNSFLTSIHK